MEIWKTINNFNRYEVSNLGKIRRKSDKKVLSLINDTNGYLRISIINNDGKRETMKIHRLVAINFINNPKSLPIINHIDGNKQNNCVENLEWCTHKENSKHSVENNLQIFLSGYHNPTSKQYVVYRDDTIFSKYESLTMLLQCLQIDKTTVDTKHKIYDELTVQLISKEKYLEINCEENKKLPSIAKEIRGVKPLLDISENKIYKSISEYADFHNIGRTKVYGLISKKIIITITRLQYIEMSGY